MHKYSQNYSYINVSLFALSPLFYSMCTCVFLCDCRDVGKSEAQAASWPNPPIAGLCGWL